MARALILDSEAVAALAQRRRGMAERLAAAQEAGGKGFHHLALHRFGARDALGRGAGGGPGRCGEPVPESQQKQKLNQLSILYQICKHKKTTSLI